MEDIFEQHNYGRRYIEANYKEALNSLETQGKIKGSPAFTERRMQKGKRTCAGKTTFTFPKPKSRN